MAELEQGLVRLVVHSEVDQAVAEHSAHEELERKVEHPLDVRSAVIGPSRGDPSFDESVPHRHRQGHVAVICRCVAGHFGLGERNVVDEGSLQRLHVHPATGIANDRGGRCVL